MGLVSRNCALRLPPAGLPVNTPQRQAPGPTATEDRDLVGVTVPRKRPREGTHVELWNCGRGIVRGIVVVELCEGRKTHLFEVALGQRHIADA